MSDSDKCTVEKSLARLACAFGVNLADLTQQYVAILPMAQAMKKKTGQDNRTAWANVLLRIRDSRLKGNILKMLYIASLGQVVGISFGLILC